MSLQVWLPLTNGTLKQQGLKNAAATIDGTVGLTDAGKLGKCATIGTAAGRITLPASTMTSFTECSVAFWIKIISWNTSYATFFQAGLSSTAWNNYIFGILRNNANSNLCFTLTNSSGSSSSAAYTTSNLNTGQWYHLAFTYKAGTICTYIDGTLDKTYSTTYVPNFAGITNISIGKGTNNSSYQTNCNLNDFRIYDHCLSPMEVKELAKGLVLHYPLNRQGLGPSNLIKNGFGELGTENWTSSANISTTDIPSGQSDIKISVTNNYTVERIKIYPTHTYKFSTWIKATTTSGYTYPSLFPYDVDGKFIDYHKCSDSFNLNTMTTLKQQLKTGDTKIYVNDLSQWNANSGHYYNWAAIFSYTDSTGYTYPDGTYTQNLGRFGSSTNAKTNLDKTNNIITLTTAYTGPNMPVGTKLCASTEGSTYYYPLGGINLANIQNWTYKEGTFSASTARLKYAKEVMFWTYTNNHMAGIKLQDLTNENLDTTTEYDCSGFCNNGSRIGTFSWTSNTPKYAVSQVFNGTDNAIQTPNLTTMITDKNYTIACWTYKTVIGTKNYQTIYGGPSGFELEARSSSSTSPLYRIHNWGGGTTAYNFGEWTHFCFVHTDSDSKLYVNGELKITGTSVNIPSGNYFVGAWNTSTSQNYEGNMSDFRIYATALSASDVKSLYQNCATIDPDGTIRGQIRS